MTAAIEPSEDSRGFRLAVLIALVAAGCAVLQQGVGGAAARAVVLIGYPVAFLVSYAARNRRPQLLRLVITGAAVLVVAIFAASLTRQPLVGFASLQIPLAEAFLWLLMIHALDSPGRRGLLVTLLASSVLMAVAGVLSVSMAMVPFLLIWAGAAVSALVLGQRSFLARLPALSSEPERRAHALSGASVAIGLSLLAVLVLGAALFTVAPVAGTSRSLTFPAQLPNSDAVPVRGGLANPSLGSADPSRPGPSGSGRRASFGYFGFSDQLDTAVRGRPDNTLVMRVRASAPDFWRAQSFDRWDGRVWRASRTRPSPVTGGLPIRVPPAPDDGPAPSIVATDDLVQTYYIERPGPNVIFAAPSPTRLFFTDRTVFQMPDGSLRAGVQLERDSVYTVVSRRRLATPTALRASDPNDAPLEIHDLYGSSPVTTARVRALAATVTASAPTTYDKVLALEAWMGAHTKYTLDIPALPRGEDAVDRFLFVDRRGFCEQIGTSLVVMLRSLGIPARLAVGYATGERNPFTGLYEVRAKDAHAWAEVYFPGVGWQAFDPTAHVPLAGDSAIDGAGTGALSYLSARIDVPSWVPGALALLAALAIAVALGGLVVVRRRTRRARVEPSWAATRLATLEGLGARWHRPRAGGETAPEYAAALAAIDPFAERTLREIAAALDAEMFGGQAPAPGGRAAVDDALADLAQRWSRAERRPAGRPLARI
ncbi:MAG TPA: DUF3488 and transglutaminase-like domain-containing protein [Acidimicrobiia bacterium]